MMHTEKQAKALWCPMARVIGDHTSFNRDRSSDGTTYWPSASKCIAARCAMWRWSRALPASDDSQSMTATEAFLNAERVTGYCGLAGAP